MNLYLPITVIKRVDKKGCQMYYDQNHFLEKGIPRKNQEVQSVGLFYKQVVHRLSRIQVNSYAIVFYIFHTDADGYMATLYYIMRYCCIKMSY